MWRLVRALLALIILLVGGLIIFKSFDYYQPDFRRGYLIGRGDYFHGIFKYGLYAHIVATPLVILIGTLQIFLRYEYRFPRMHKWLGRVYAILIIGFAAPGGIIIGAYSLGSPWIQLNFFVLGPLWIVYMLAAWYFARQGQMIRHQRFIIRGYILTASAVALRILSFVFIQYLDWQGADMYAWAVWLSWAPFLAIYEIILLLKPTPQKA